MYEDVPPSVTKRWWKNLRGPKRRYPGSKNMKVLYAIFDGNPERMDYITSRQKVYVPEYYEMIKNKNITLKWKDIVRSGQSVTVYDFDGPRTAAGDVMCLEVTKNMLIEKLTIRPNNLVMDT